MRWESDEILFYGGLICAVGIVFVEIICQCIFLIRKHRLEMQMDKEYGERK